ncbi:hypothetical protein HLB23_29915 [Nocardia uniformis]|uniref:Uncharacterized protein n=1 Tax=Nocardia uniformis TaxID=53432 RepID=A0A849C5W5_9NOCA|nr:hypothetical protein [Nocardia uniformis]NNH74022.1 hypothetical protein [Nocardia uniformis]
MPHDPHPAPEPIPLSLSVPPRPARGLTDGLVRAVSSEPGSQVLDLDASDTSVAEFLVRVVHSEGGFVARTSSGERAVAIIAATVAALMGEDIHAALTAPDLAFLIGLKPPAVEALREVLLAIETDDQAGVNAALAVLTTAARQ